jgi:preprotein translocase subunit SecY
MFAVYVIGLHIPIPGVDRATLSQVMGKNGAGGNLVGLIDVFSGGAFRQFTIFAMGIIPYINASIIMQLLTFALPNLQELSREGESGRRKIAQYTRYGTVFLAFLQAAGVCWLLYTSHVLTGGIPSLFPTCCILVAGTSFLMWLGEMIQDRGIGNGVSLIIFAGIMVRLPYQIEAVYKLATSGGAGGPASVAGWQVVLLIAAFFATVVGIVYVTLGQRRIPIQHVRRIVGNRMSQGGTSYLPFRVNSAGVIPIIFAVSIQLLPLTISQMTAKMFPLSSPIGRDLDKIVDYVTPGRSHMWYIALISTLFYAGIIMFFTYFYTAVTMDIPHIAEDLKKYGSYIPGIKPGKQTQEYLDKVMTRITLAGAVFLATIALLQDWVPAWTGTGGAFTLVGGTSLLIVVGVALDTMQAIEAQLLMRHYEGFIR